LFVEREPVVSFHNSVYDLIFPFDLSNPLGWGYESVWSYLLAKHDLKMGIVDITPVDRSLRKPTLHRSWNHEDVEDTTFLNEYGGVSYEQCFKVLNVIVPPAKEKDRSK
jgi:hypothetical protein